MNPQPAGQHLRHPLVLIMMVTWALNDHVLKDAYGQWWTGKLSDVSGLVVFPIMLYSLYEVYYALQKRHPQSVQGAIYLSLLATGGILICINLFVSMEVLCGQIIAHLQWPFRAVWSLINKETLPPLNQLKTTMDPTDLWTLPTLLIPYWIMKPRDKTRLSS